MPDSKLFDKLKTGLRTVTVDGTTHYLVEGDLLLTEDELRAYAAEREALDRVREAARDALDGGKGLLAMLDMTETTPVNQQGRIVRWKPGLTLTYCVLRSTFADQAQYDLITSSMQQATADWAQNCGVLFEYKSDLDGSTDMHPQGVIFPVRGFDAQGQFIAASFFPNDPPERRWMLVDPSYFGANLVFDKVGVFRHELGHVLGFRHEHIRSGAPPVCPHEDTWDTAPLTDYDPRSVMHYFCGGVGNPALAITDFDRVGAQKVYGPALPALDSKRYLYCD